LPSQEEQNGRFLHRPQQDYPAATVAEFCTAVLSVRCLREGENMAELTPYIEFAAQTAKLITYLMVMRQLAKRRGARKRP
jgi:hypothetical protein